jgi:hypothetical protein
MLLKGGAKPLVSDESLLWRVIDILKDWMNERRRTWEVSFVVLFSSFFQAEKE